MGEPSQTTMVNTVARVTFDMRCEDEDTSRWASFARETKARADAAWDHASKASAEGDELAGTYWRGQAHALCMILGDQTQLDHLLHPDPADCIVCHGVGWYYPDPEQQGPKRTCPHRFAPKPEAATPEEAGHAVP
jgi:hypothetical protein